MLVLSIKALPKAIKQKIKMHSIRLGEVVAGNGIIRKK